MLTNPDTAGVTLKPHASRHVVTLAIHISKPALGASGRLGWVRWLIGVGLEHDIPQLRRDLRASKITADGSGGR